MDIHDRIQGCLIGGAIGDALGYPIEFMSEEEIAAKYGAGGITEYDPDAASGKALISELLELIDSYKKEIKDLRYQVKVLEAENAELKNKTRHNARNAGRKKYGDAFIQRFSAFCELYESGKSIDEIIQLMDISRVTYYRYKKLYDDTPID